MRKLRLANEDPAPNMDITRTFWTLRSDALTASMTAVADCDMKSGGEVVAAKGFPDVRVWPSVLIITTEPLVRDRAVLMSAASRGEPLDILRLVCGGREEVDRISAMTLWPRFNADSRTRRPVRPVAPMSRMSGRPVEVPVDMVKQI